MGKIVEGKEKSFSVIISAQEFQALPSLMGCCDDIRNTEAVNW